ncbi:MAG TPA: hypothetical protein VGG12_01155 [Methylovirgula sp.]|jgi:hypothetical protein
MMMANDNEKRPRLETPAQWAAFSLERAKDTPPGVTLARAIGNRLQIVYPATDLREEPEDIQALLAELKRKGF